MPLSAGERLGSYEILALIGSGGMGKVYRARDPRLGREVAIKVSEERFSERFEHEARVIASLNHPNICTLYDVGPNYLVMELVEGDTLSDRIKAGPMPLEDALPIARQIADALDSAHEKGVVHRDLKPGNVKIKPDETLKVLDFGLAKTGGTQAASSDESPTLSMGQTEAGVILGTAAYMAPEQAKGKPVDKRADVYAFGSVLYEMLTGQRLHRGETTSDVLASVIKDEPRWDIVPSRAQRLLKNCLQKDPQKRLRHIGDVMRLVDETPDGKPVAPPVSPTQPEPATKRSLPNWLLPAAGVAILAAALILWSAWRKTESAQVVKFEVGAPDKITMIERADMAISPDGRWMVFPAVGEDGAVRYYLRSLDGVEVRPLPGTEGPTAPPAAWSYDSRWVFFANSLGLGKLKKIDIQGGAPQEVAAFQGTLRGGDWNSDGVIIAGENRSPIVKVPASGGTLAPVTALAPGETYHGWPQFLPDGRHFLYVRASPDSTKQGVYLGSIDVQPNQQSNDRLLVADGQAYFARTAGSSSGYLVFLRGTTLMAQQFDPSKRSLTGEPVAVADGVDSMANVHGLFTVSNTGALVYRRGSGPQTVLTWLDPEGKPLAAFGDRGEFASPAVSPDGSRVAVVMGEPGARDIWIVDVARGSSTRFTFDPADDTDPAWSPDGKYIAFTSNRGGSSHIYMKPADNSGEEKPILKTEERGTQPQWTKDGHFLLFLGDRSAGNPGLWVLPFPSDAKPVRLLQDRVFSRDARVSPDGHWLAYDSTKSGTSEVYVRAFAPGSASSSAAEWLVSKGGGMRPRWRPDGKELFYLIAGTFGMGAAEINTAGGFKAGTPHRIFTAPSSAQGAGWDISPDGKRLLFAAAPDFAHSTPFTVVLNWAAGLKK